MPVQRKFDWDEAARLYWQGVLVSELAERFGVGSSSIRRAVVPGELDRVADKTRLRRLEIAACDRCGGPMRAFSRKRGSRLCVDCGNEDKRTSVRPDRLRCWRCRQWKPDEAFGFLRRNVARRGRSSECKECRTALRLSKKVKR